MNSKFVLALLLIASSLGVLMWFATSETSKPVVKVEELAGSSETRRNIRLGARVAGDKIDYTTTPEFELRFLVRDPAGDDSKTISVVYHSIKPDTLQIGRDVILEGNYDGTQFVATQLLTQCPSKYEPPSSPDALKKTKAMQ